METRPVDLVIADAGPLITLAIAGELGLLQLFQRPILIPDVVKAECLFDRGKPGYDELVDWFDYKRDQHRVVGTTRMSEYDAAFLSPVRDRDLLEHLGEKAMAEVILGLKADDERMAIAVLSEDGKAGDAMIRETGRELTLLSTRAFLTGLEMKGKIASMQDILSRVSKAGRDVSRYNRDQPERDSRNNRITDWRKNLPDGVEVR